MGTWTHCRPSRAGMLLARPARRIGRRSERGMGVRGGYGRPRPVATKPGAGADRRVVSEPV